MAAAVVALATTVVALAAAVVALASAVVALAAAARHAAEMQPWRDRWCVWRW